MDLSGQDELLQRLVDGELDPRTRREVEARLEEDSSAADQVRALRRMRELVVLARDEQAAGLDSEALFARITAGVETDPQPVVTEPRASRMLVWLRGWLKGGAAVSAGAVAVAAAVLLTIYLPAERAAPDAVAEGRGSATARATAGSEIVRVDFGGSTGTVFEIALAGGTSTPVVWINDGE